MTCLYVRGHWKHHYRGVLSCDWTRLLCAALRRCPCQIHSARQKCGCRWTHPKARCSFFFQRHASGQSGLHKGVCVCVCKDACVRARACKGCEPLGVVLCAILSGFLNRRGRNHFKIYITYYIYIYTTGSRTPECGSRRFGELFALHWRNYVRFDWCHTTADGGAHEWIPRRRPPVGLLQHLLPPLPLFHFPLSLSFPTPPAPPSEPVSPRLVLDQRTSWILYNTYWSTVQFLAAKWAPLLLCVSHWYSKQWVSRIQK